MNKIILIIVAVLILGVGGYFVLTKEDKTPDQPNQQPSITENKIIIKNFAFNPAMLTVKNGTTVIWTNEDSVPHQIKSDIFNSEIINKGGSFQFKFNNTGTYDYICGLHPSMRGEIIVQE